MRSNKSQMGFVTKPFGFGHGQNALIDPGWEQAWYGRDKRGIAIVTRWPWNRRCIVARKSLDQDPPALSLTLKFLGWGWSFHSDTGLITRRK